jgi:DNA-binding SARP family transcriptional activator/tetratricopeptide (TPR) repeat protein
LTALRPPAAETDNGRVKVLEIVLLGRFAVTVEGRPAGGFEHRRGADLVKVLALAPGHRLARDRVVELLWPALPADAGVANLHKAAHYARRALGDRRAVVLRNGFVELAPDATVTTDVERFEAGEDAAYGGTLLPDDEYEPWAVPARERLQHLHVERLRRDGRWEELLEADPAAEDAHRALMRAALEAGDRVAAARRLRTLRDELSELGLQPEEETLLLAGELAEGPAVEAPLGPRAPILGRDAEIGLAARVLQQATAGRGTTLVVTGDAGIGKTRYVDAVLALAQRRGWHTLRGAAHGDHADVPYRPLAEALEVLLAERPDLLAGLATGARDALGGLVPAAASAGGELPGRSQRHAALAAVAHLARAAARERGLVLALEDLHAADEATLQAIDYLATTVRREPVVIVAAARPVAAEHPFARLAATLRRHGTGTDVPLETLADEDVRALVEQGAGAPLPADTVEAIVRTAAGNPFYAQELAAATGATGGLRVPRHVEDALDARLDRLPPDAVALLPALAVAGTAATPDALAADSELPAARAASALAEAAAEGVLRRQPDGWDFRHPLLREAVARRTAPATLARAHARAAARFAATDGAPQQVAHHLLAAGDGAAAVPFLIAAARRAAAVGAYADGRRALEQALPHAGPEDRAALHALLADLRYATGDRAAAAAYATALRSAAEDDVAELKVKQALAAIVAGDLDAAERALAAVPAGTPRAAATAGLVTWFRGDVEGAARHAEVAQALLDESGDDLPILNTLRALVAHARGRWEAHTELELSPGWHVPELAGQVFDAYLCVTECVLHLGDPEDRLAAFAEDLHRQAVRAGARRGEAFAATVIGEAHLLAGRPELARAHLQEAAAVSRRIGAVSGESLARARLGEALHALGDDVGARASLAEALELAHASALAHHLLFLVHVPMLRMESDPVAALALVETSRILLEDQGACVFCPVAYAIAAASACVRGGELELAEALLARARASAAMWPPGAWSPGICEVAGELARARGDERQAAMLLRRAVDGYEASGQRLYETRAAATLAAAV